MPPASNRTQRKSPRDFTGLRSQQLSEEAAKTKAREAQISDELRRSEVEDRLNTEVDYASHAKTRTRQSVEIDGELQVEDIEVEVPTRRIRVTDDIKEMTWGREILSAGVYDERGIQVVGPVLGSLKMFNFERGRWYTVDAELADHLEFLGYVSD
jgi:hypothetical protein